MTKTYLTSSSHLPRACSVGILVWDFCSGTGGHGRDCASSMADDLLQTDDKRVVRCITLDCSSRHSQPDLKVDLEAWDNTHTAALLARFPSLFKVGGL